ncbi:DUF6265 family protein [Reichenbachiella agarivorans]|uniref:DUF6265 family protein n=1 Tax=Reichenbachiella agarivorans TaxID=2979464 RepID=A0ABY6CP83_9BACT|nr:DUF6265 family protein [Reichenbachiella agarivorans]UXP31840.1 DUF6265 family protein [Reichenbachiella agarivorans]
MKQILILATSIWMIACTSTNQTNTQQESTDAPKKIESFDWLLGKWERLNEAEGLKTYENWDKISTTEYTGIGFTMQNEDTLKQERMKLIHRSGKWDLTVKVPEETESVTFAMTNYTDSTFVFENQEIDFPNTIKYWKNGNKINALVANTEMKISFEFKKQTAMH